MSTQARAQDVWALAMPVQMSRHKGRLFSVVMHLSVGPFMSEAAARAWEREFVRQHSLLTETKSAGGEGRTLQGDAVRHLTGAAQMEVSLVPDGMNPQEPELHFYITDGIASKVEPRSLGEYDLDVRGMSPVEAVRNFGFIVRNFLHKALDE